MKEKIGVWLSEESGQGLTEYALILALVSIAVVSVLMAISGTLDRKYEEIQSAVSGI